MVWLRLLIFVLVFEIAASAGAAESDRLPGIKGADDRATVDSSVFPWRAIGRLNKRIGGYCTATLVGARVVLTAAHCLWNPRTRRFLPPVSVHFVAGWSRGAYLADAAVKSFYVSPTYDPKQAGISAALAHDWAVAILDHDVTETLGRFDVEPLDEARLDDLKAEGAIFIQAGYSQDRKHVLTVHDGCEIIGFSAKRPLIYHRCDAVAGDSGSPIFFRTGDRYRIVAIHVATSQTTQGSVGLAVPGAAFREAIRQSDSGTPPAGRRVQ